MDYCSVCWRTFSRKVISLSSRLAQLLASPKSCHQCAGRAMGVYLHAVSACANEVVPIVLLFAGFVGAGLQGLCLFSEAGIVCLYV